MRTLRKPSTLLAAVVTNAVVANCVVFVPTAAVGAVGAPVKAGEILKTASAPVLKPVSSEITLAS